MDSILSAVGVEFKKIIHYPDIRIEQKKTTFIIGNSGCGKSTLLKLFNKTLSPDKGKIYYQENDIEEYDTIQLRQEVLLAGQSVYLFQGSIEENFRKYYAYRGKGTPEKSQMEEFLALCCAAFPLHTICNTMSGGERQRVYLSIALSLKPKVFMMDEPTSALDSDTSDRLLKNLKGYSEQNGITLVVISHNSFLTEKYADQSIYLERQERNGSSH